MQEFVERVTDGEDLTQEDARAASRAVFEGATEAQIGALLAALSLARHPGRVHTHRAILQAVWGPAYGTETQYLRVYASQLRKKLRDDPTAPRLVTEPGVGYRLVDPTEATTAKDRTARVRKAAKRIKTKERVSSRKR